MKKRKKVKTGHQIWTDGRELSLKKHAKGGWSDADHNCFAYGYEDGYVAAVRELTKKARRT